jgi:hypothetical protein
MSHLRCNNICHKIVRSRDSVLKYFIDRQRIHVIGPNIGRLYFKLRRISGLLHYGMFSSMPLWIAKNLGKSGSRINQRQQRHAVKIYLALLISSRSTQS